MNALTEIVPGRAMRSVVERARHVVLVDTKRPMDAAEKAMLSRYASALDKMRSMTVAFTTWVFREPRNVTRENLIEVGCQLWGALGLALEMREYLGEDGVPAETMDVIWERIGTTAGEEFPRLTPEARIDVRAASFALSAVLARAQEAEAREGEQGAGVRWLVKLASKTPDEVVSLVGREGADVMFSQLGLMQALDVAGSKDGEIPQVAGDAIAHTLWRYVRDQVSAAGMEEAVEDAYLAAKTLEIKLAAPELKPMRGSPQ